MAWLLLQSNGRPERADRTLPSAHGAWVLVGGLSEALYQAGYIGELLAHGQLPSRVVGAGFGAVNAVLASAGVTQSIVKGWERLRGRHFIMSAALDEAGGLAARLVTREAIAAAARHAAGFVNSRAEVMLVLGERFMPCSTIEGSRTSDLLASAIVRTDVEPDTIAAAIRAAAAQRDSTVTVWGADEWTASSPLVLKAIADAAEIGATIRFVPCDSGPAPSLLELLLPGSGAVERAMCRGRNAASDTLRLMK